MTRSEDETHYLRTDGKDFVAEKADDSLMNLINSGVFNKSTNALDEKAVVIPCWLVRNVIKPGLDNSSNDNEADYVSVLVQNWQVIWIFFYEKTDNDLNDALSKFNVKVHLDFKCSQVNFFFF